MMLTSINCIVHLRTIVIAITLNIEKKKTFHDRELNRLNNKLTRCEDEVILTCDVTNWLNTNCQ